MNVVSSFVRLLVRPAERHSRSRPRLHHTETHVFLRKHLQMGDDRKWPSGLTANCMSQQIDN